MLCGAPSASHPGGGLSGAGRLVSTPMRRDRPPLTPEGEEVFLELNPTGHWG